MDLRKYISGLLFVLVGFTFSFSDVHAAEPLSAKIGEVTGNGSLVMSPGERMDVFVEFLNTGTQTWRNDGYGYVSLYTYAPKYRKTVFDPGTWIWGDHVQRIRESSVAPGETGTMIFELHAPQETGVYHEVFQLASEDTAWIDGGELDLNIEVRNQHPAEPDTNAAGNEQPQATNDPGLSAKLVVQSAKRVKSKAGTQILFTAAFENTGTKTWNSYGMTLPGVAIASESADFSHASWNGDQVVYVADAPVPPGGTAVVNFVFNTPDVNGTHTATFQLEANGLPVDGADIKIPVEVTGGAPAGTLGTSNEAAETKTYIPEPDIRVGVLIVDEETDDEVVITSLESAFDVKNLDGEVLAELAAGDQVTAYYYGGKYYYDIGEGAEVSAKALRFEPRTEHAVMRVANWDKRLTRGSRYADNEFRGVLEMRYNEYKERVWLINELGIDYYLRGLAETSNEHPFETNKAQVTAARSYAYYHVSHGGKRPKEYMDLNSTPSDQYYLGYGQEKRGTEIVKAVEATRGSVVTYQGSVAVTPYYARSNGSTKDWNKVWAGDQPYVRGVAVPCDAGKTQWGHGLGMPQSGATCMAEDGAKWDEILTYFYTGVEIERLWK